ncbi:MAG: RecX family transcriptional regulator [Bacteroidaceae bacterium]|nr:RecX family transcriptional regulator [Bacteroidaceae bacterium]
MVHCTSTQALQRLTTLCAKAEYCRQEIWRKLSRWQLADDPETDQAAKQEILNHLVSQHYIDEQRYAHAFVRDKFRYNRWGRMRIQQELYKRGIAEDVINRALEEELSDEDTTETLRHLIAAKRRTVKGKNDYEINGKLIRFALSHGFDMDTIRKVIHEAPDYD